MGNKIGIGHAVMITGGGGYLGAKLAERLVNSQCDIYLVDISFNKLVESLGKNHENIYCKFLDLRSRDRVFDLCAQIKPDFIFHFASIINRNRDFSIYDQLYEVNVKGTLNLLEALRDNPYLGFYFSSTSEVYGPWEGIPFHEDKLLHPMSPYSLTKVYCENMLQVFSEIYGKSYKIFRIFNFFGPDISNNTFIGQMFESFKNGTNFEMTGGEQARDILFIEDLLDQISLVLESDSEHSLFNICSGKSLKMIEIAEEFREVTKCKFSYTTNLPYRKNEVWETRGDNSRIRSLGGDSSNLELGQMLEKCIDFYRNNSNVQ